MHFAPQPTLQLWYRLILPHGDTYEDFDLVDCWVSPEDMIVDIRDKIYRRLDKSLPHLDYSDHLSLWRNISEFTQQIELPQDATAGTLNCSRLEPLIICIPDPKWLSDVAQPDYSTRADCEEYIEKIVNKFDFFYEIRKPSSAVLSFEDIYQARLGEEGVDWIFRNAVGNVDARDSHEEPLRIISDGHQLTHRKLPTLYCESEWDFIHSVDTALRAPNHANAIPLTSDTFNRLQFVSYESFWDL
jgi:hypothetical protein